VRETLRAKVGKANISLFVLFLGIFVKYGTVSVSVHESKMGFYFLASEIHMEYIRYARGIQNPTDAKALAKRIGKKK